MMHKKRDPSPHTQAVKPSGLMLRIVVLRVSLLVVLAEVWRSIER